MKRRLEAAQDEKRLTHQQIRYNDVKLEVMLDMNKYNGRIYKNGSTVVKVLGYITAHLIQAIVLQHETAPIGLLKMLPLERILSKYDDITKKWRK